MKPALWSGVFVLLVLTLAPAYWKALHNPLAGTYHDDGIYLVTAKALASGQGYGIISLPEPMIQTKYPPVYPWLLSLVWRVTPSFPQNLTALLSVSLIASLAWMLAVYALAKQEGLSQSAIFFVIAMSASSMWTLGLSTIALSETTFAALCTGSLALLKLAEKKRSKWLIVFSALLSGLAFLTRSIGITIPAAALIWLLYKRCREAVLMFGIVALVVIAPWFIWCKLHGSPTGWVESYYSARSYGINSVLLSFSLGQKANIIGTNLLYLFLSPASLLNLAPSPIWLTLTVSALLFFALLRNSCKHFCLLPIVLITYAVALTCTCGGLGVRYAAPVFPLALIVAVQGPKLKNRLTLTLVTVAAGLLLCHSVFRLYVSADQIAAGHKAWTSEDNDPAELRNLTSWIQANVPQGKIVSANLDPLFYLYTGHKTVRGFAPKYYESLYKTGTAKQRPVGTADDLRRELRTNHVEYLVIMPDKDFLEIPFFQKLEKQLIRDRPSAFHRIYKGKLPGYEVIAVDWEKL